MQYAQRVLLFIVLAGHSLAVAAFESPPSSSVGYLFILYCVAFLGFMAGWEANG